MFARITERITLWRIILAVIFVAGMYSTYVRFFEGLRASTNLSDQMPWGLWVGLGTLCGIGLSAAGFGISAAVYLLGMERFRPILRASILISFLGYCTVMVGYLYEIGLPWRFWHPVVMWNGRSVLFDVCVCIMTYFTVLMFEFAPALIEQLPWKRLRESILEHHHRILAGVVLAGVLLSSMHQSFLGGLYLIAAGKLHPLWYSPYIHAMFYMSAIPAGLALTVMAVYLSMRSLNVRLDFSILTDCGRMIQLLLIVFAFFRVLDLVANHAVRYAFQWTPEAGYFWLEMAMFILAPIALLSYDKVRDNPDRLYLTCALVVAGFIVNRLNVSINALQTAMGTHYVPKWTELASSIMMVAAAVVAFRYAVIYLDILPKQLATPKGMQRWIGNGGISATA
ncbi:MAG TPA: NrfD/PsrC family molybdoenzyme membrane anchor subunit [Candidatus Angelobacter sp.]|jgi:Ni/Fe-hydrogenase subunit HybB-like protein|nr:NrfD/PsrC family molybdoenzyme membrane anchor subunit [Candidatus Angelobacter sp.]